MKKADTPKRGVLNIILKKMVAIYPVEDFGDNSKTLGDWVKDFRLKKLQMKRKLRFGGELRICAILSTALTSAELELRRKQQQRFQKWLEFQNKIKSNEIQAKTETQQNVNCMQEIRNSCEEEKACQPSEHVSNLWKYELNELDNFMRSINNCNQLRREQKENSKNITTITTTSQQHIEVFS